MTTSSTQSTIQARPTFHTATPRHRAAAAALAATISLGIGSALLSAFHFASPTRWLAPTPDVLIEVARCEQLPLGSAQVDCKQAFVTAQLSPTSTPATLFAGR